jgi:hypothetical protein
MTEQQAAKTKRRPKAMDLWRLVMAIIAVVAIVQELRKAAEDRTWHGKVAGFVPYDFRKPTPERLRDTYWNPEGPMVSSKAWGVGWAPNFGAVKKAVAGAKARNRTA